MMSSVDMGAIWSSSKSSIAAEDAIGEEQDGTRARKGKALGNKNEIDSKCIKWRDLYFTPYKIKITFSPLTF